MSKRSPVLSDTPVGYAEWLAELKTRIHTAQQRAALAVNRELVLLYWQIGRDILARQADQGWGATVIERLAHDLRTAFPEMKGFSPRNLKYMRAFAEAWPDNQFVQAALAQLPWYHQLALLDKLKTEEERRWYAAKAIVESATTSEEMRPEDFDGANAAITDLLPELQIRVEQFFATVVELAKTAFEFSYK